MSTTTEAHTRLINRLFGSGLTLAGVLSWRRLDCEVADQVRRVVAELDSAIAQIHHLGLTEVRAEAQHKRPDAMPTQPMNRRCTSHANAAGIRSFGRFESSVPLYECA